MATSSPPAPIAIIPIPPPVGVWESDPSSVLPGVVVDVGDRQLGLYPWDAHRLELQVRHRPGGVLGERLVDPDGDLLARLLLPGHVVVPDDFFHNVPAHGDPPSPLQVGIFHARQRSVDSIRFERPAYDTQSGRRNQPPRGFPFRATERVARGDERSPDHPILAIHGSYRPKQTEKFFPQEN